jgi:hypothetical protein
VTSRSRGDVCCGLLLFRLRLIAGLALLAGLILRVSVGVGQMIHGLLVKVHGVSAHRRHFSLSALEKLVRSWVVAERLAGVSGLPAQPVSASAVRVAASVRVMCFPRRSVVKRTIGFWLDAAFPEPWSEL